MNRFRLLQAALFVAASALSLADTANAADTPAAASRPAAQKKSPAAVEGALLAVRQRQYAQAAQSLTVAANAGNADAQYLLGMILLNGLGQLPDAAQAAAWLEKAATQGQREAAFVLAAVLSRGEHTDLPRARTWLQRSADLGYERARSALADPRPLLTAERTVPKDAALLRELVLYAAAADDVVLLGNLGTSALAARDDFGCTALCTAVIHQSVAASTWLLQQGADPQAADSFGVTPLMQAATQESPALLSLLLDRKPANPDAVDQERRTALFYAARANRPQSVRLLQLAGATLAATDSRGYGALDIATLADAKDAAATLRELGARPQANVSAHGDTVSGIDVSRPGALYREWSAAELAAARDDVAQLRAQLAAPGTLQQRTPQGDTLVHVAYHAGALDALRLLVEAGADADALDRRKRSVLMLAAADNNAAVVQLLTGAGRTVHGTRESALLLAVAANAQDAVRLLLAAGADASWSDESGTSALSTAARLGQAELVKLLLTHGASINAVDRAGRSALWLAARGGDSGTVAALLEAQAKVDAADQERNTPLMAAITAGRTAAVKQLMAAGAQTDLVNHNGDTPLMLAAAAGQAETVRVLLLRAHKIDAQNRHGDTAVILASRNGNAAVCRELLKNGASLKLRNGNRLNAADAARDRGFIDLANELASAG
jgi:ankyrin repeat protein